MSVPGWQAMRIMLLLASTLSYFAEGALPPYPMSDEELKEMGGYYDGDGKYLGGIAKINVGSPSYDKCTLFLPRDEVILSESSTETTESIPDDAKIICWEWNQDQNANIADGDVIDNCWCYKPAVGNRYCEKWTCNRVQINNVAYCTNDATRRLLGTPEDEGFHADGDEYVRLQDDENTHGNLRHLQVGGGCSSEIAAGSTKCRCDIDERDLEYCPTWSCETYIGATKFETFTCYQPGANGLYCESWTGVIEESERKSVEACRCATKTGGDNAICGFAECVERSISKCKVCNLGLSIGLWSVLGILGILMLMQRCFGKDYFSPCVLFAIIWIAGAGAGVALYGGQDGGMYGGIMWVVAIVCFFCCCRPPKET